MISCTSQAVFFFHSNTVAYLGFLARNKQGWELLCSCVSLNACPQLRLWYEHHCIQWYSFISSQVTWDPKRISLWWAENRDWQQRWQTPSPGILKTTLHTILLGLIVVLLSILPCLVPELFFKVIRRMEKEGPKEHTQRTAAAMGLLCCSTRIQTEINSFWFGQGDCSHCSMQSNGRCVRSSNKEKGNASGKFFRSNATLMKMEELISGSSSFHCLHEQLSPGSWPFLFPREEQRAQLSSRKHLRTPNPLTPHAQVRHVPTCILSPLLGLYKPSLISG